MKEIKAHEVSWSASREGQEAFKLTGHWYGIRFSRVIITLGVDDMDDILETDAYADGMLWILNKIQVNAEHITKIMEEGK